MNSLSGVLLLFALVVSSHQQRVTNLKLEEFHEELFVKPLPSEHVNTYFQFTTRWHYGDKSNLYNTRLIPRPIAEVLMRFDVKELQITLTQGLWRYESWGYPVIDVAPGAEAWAWFGSPNLTNTNVDRQWVELMGTFSGILCSSLNFIDGTNSVEPKYGFRPRFASKPIDNATVPTFVRYATLPRENVCTENLTPWKKLLPCNSKIGFASLLNSGFVHNTNFHALGISMRTLCDSPDTNCILEFVEFANLVYDPKILGLTDFSLRRMFGQGLNGHCVLADSSKIYVNMDDSRYTLTPEPPTELVSIRGGSMARFGVYDMQLVPTERFFNIAWLKKKSQPTIELTRLPPIYAHRYILGHGQESGKIVTQITNNHYDPLPIVLQENIPWYVASYMHTLRITVTSPLPEKQIEAKAMHYIPGAQRYRPYHLELCFVVPAHSTVQVGFDFDYTFLKWLEYPPDANHGYYLGAAVISTQLIVAHNYTAIPVEGYLFAHSFNASQSAYFLEMRTEPLILSLPTPDFSMPYNVICLACTVVALAFGPIHSVATKKIVVETQDVPHTFLGKLKQKFFGKKKAATEVSNTSSDSKNDAEMHTKAE